MRINKPLILVIVILLLAHLAQFWPFYIHHLLPFPGDMLVGFFFPWSGGGFAGFDPWTSYKALNTVDTIKQFYPWKIFFVDMLRQGVLPLWNPYSFSGMPFIANVQSGVFFPLNIVYLFVPVLVGWIGNILGQLFLFGAFFYLFLRSEKLSRLASVFGAVVGMNLSYITLWHWQLVITQSALFLPLILYFVNRFAQEKKNTHLLFVSILITIGFLGGHAQTTIYVYLIFFLFSLFKGVPFKKIVVVSLIPVGLAAVQIIPSIETYLLSAREGIATKDLFAPFVFHWKNIITVLAPDFFGNPSSRNYVGTDYRDMNAYYGITAFIFSLISLHGFHKNKNIKFFVTLAVMGLLFATWPLVFIFDIFKIPILSSGVPARMIFVFQFAGAVLAAFGFQHWWQSKIFPKKILILGGLIIGILWVVALGTHDIVARNNLVLPTVFMAVTGFAIILRRKISIVIIFVILFLQYSYFFNRYNSFSPEAFVFPRHTVISYLQKNSGIDRFFGTEQAIFNQNFSVVYHLFDFEGYDSMYPLRYGQLISSVTEQSIPKIVPRSDASVSKWSDRATGRLLDILGVKYLLDKNDKLTLELDPQTDIFSANHYNLLWQRGKWRIFERRGALPRIGLFGDFVLETDSQKIIKTLYDPNFDYQHKLILEQLPQITPKLATTGKVNVVSYQPNRVEVETQAEQPQLLYLSDNFFPGWKATVDGKDVPILRANYTFRAVSLSEGKHVVIFQYDPISFKIGLAISLLSIIFLCKKIFQK